MRSNANQEQVERFFSLWNEFVEDVDGGRDIFYVERYRWYMDYNPDQPTDRWVVDQSVYDWIEKYTDGCSDSGVFARNEPLSIESDYIHPYCAYIEQEFYTFENMAGEKTPFTQAKIKSFAEWLMDDTINNVENITPLIFNDFN